MKSSLLLLRNFMFRNILRHISDNSRKGIFQADISSSMAFIAFEAIHIFMRELKMRETPAAAVMMYNPIIADNAIAAINNSNVA